MIYGIPKHFEGATWENWVARAELEFAVKRLREWDGAPPFITLLPAEGGTNLGTGKSRALCTIVADWRENRQKKAWYIPVSLIVQKERRLMRGELQDERDHRGTQDWCCATEDMLAIDDVGAERDREWSVAILEAIADHRYANELATVFATNLDERALQERYPRLWRRCTEGLMIGWQATMFDKERAI
jgi:hypothetical protein